MADRDSESRRFGDLNTDVFIALTSISIHFDVEGFARYLRSVALPRTRFLICSHIWSPVCERTNSLIEALTAETLYSS